MSDFINSATEIASSGLLDYLGSLNTHFMAAFFIILIGIRYKAFEWWLSLFKKDSKFVNVATGVVVMAFYLLLSPAIDWSDVSAIKIYIGTLMHSIITTLVIYEILLPYITKRLRGKITSLIEKKDSDGEK